MPAAPISRLLEALSRTPLLDDAQRAQLAELQQQHEEPRALARAIVRRGWLTVHQINAIAQGRGDELTVGPYVILNRIGEGGMGQVFKARQMSLQRIVALKVIRPEYLANARVVRRFQREILAASQLVHPNVVRAYDADQLEGAYYIAMEYVEGIDLARLVKQSGPLPVWQACDLIRQAALGLQHAFERGLVHRDIKPANLLVTRLTGQGSAIKEVTKPRDERSVSRGSGGHAHPVYVLKIADFGLARWADDDPDRPTSHLTQLGTVLGTPEYIAPEQARCSRTCDIRADLYSLGCTFYFLLAGQVPFPGGSLADKLLAHQLDQPEPVSKVRAGRLANGPSIPDDVQVPAEVAQVVAKLMAKEPAERYQTPAELADTLAAVQDQLTRAVLRLPSRPQPETLAEFAMTPQRPALPVVKAPARTSRRIAAPVPAPSRPARRRRLWPWLVVPVVALMPLMVIGAGALVLAVLAASETVVEPPIVPSTGADEVAWQTLLQQADVRQTPAAVRQQLLAYRAQFPSSTHTSDVDAWLGRLPSPFDAFDGRKLPKVALVTAKPPPEMVAVLGGHAGYLKRAAGIVAVSPDSRWLLGAEDAVLRVWDTADFSRPPARLHPHGKRVHVALFAPDGKRLVTAGDDPTIRSWDPLTLKPLPDVGKHEAPVTRLAFRRDGSQLASAGADGQIRVWDMASGTAIASFEGGRDEICSLVFSPDGATLFWGEGPRVRWTRMGTAVQPGVFDTPDAVHVLVFAPDGRTLVCGGGQGRLLVCTWDGQQLTRRAVLAHPVTVGPQNTTPPVNQAAYSPNGRLLATAGSDHRVRIWDARGLALQKEWDLRCPVVSVAFSPDGRHVISGNGNSTLTVFRLGELVRGP